MLEDSESKGCLSHAAANLAMKYMWFGRIGTPDFLAANGACGCRITRWDSKEMREIITLSVSHV